MSVHCSRRNFGSAWSSIALLAIGFVTLANFALAETGKNSGPPAAAREFRGVWVATVENIDWPSKPGLSSEQQQQEMIAILDKCVELNLNAVVFQVRTQADAFYPSKFEPWSEFLTGKMGEAPEAVLRSARVCRERSTSPRIATPRVVQSVSGSSTECENRGVRQACQRGPSGDRSAIWQVPVV